MFKTIFETLFLLSLAGQLLALVIGVAMLAWPKRRAGRTVRMGKQVSAHL